MCSRSMDSLNFKGLLFLTPLKPYLISNYSFYKLWFYIDQKQDLSYSILSYKPISTVEDLPRTEVLPHRDKPETRTKTAHVFDPPVLHDCMIGVKLWCRRRFRIGEALRCPSLRSLDWFKAWVLTSQIRITKPSWNLVIMEKPDNPVAPRPGRKSGKR
jgi:hypothetical protein